LAGDRFYSPPALAYRGDLEEALSEVKVECPDLEDKPHNRRILMDRFAESLKKMHPGNRNMRKQDIYRFCLAGVECYFIPDDYELAIAYMRHHPLARARRETRALPGNV
jgi:hypothetical protein